MAAQVKEVVMDSDLIEMQDLFPDVTEDLFFGSPGRNVFMP
jgi:hypothetical protein